MKTASTIKGFIFGIIVETYFVIIGITITSHMQNDMESYIQNEDQLYAAGPLPDIPVLEKVFISNHLFDLV